MLRMQARHLVTNILRRKLKYFKGLVTRMFASRNGTRGEAERFLGDVKRPELNISLDDGGKPVKCRGSP